MAPGGPQQRRRRGAARPTRPRRSPTASTTRSDDDAARRLGESPHSQASRLKRWGTATVAGFCSLAATLLVIITCATTSLCALPPGSAATPVASVTPPSVFLRNRSAYVQTVVVNEEFPHDTSAFTQGLCVDVVATGDDGKKKEPTLWESDGLYAKSRVRRIDLATGRSIQQVANDRGDFGEGLTVVDIRTTLESQKKSKKSPSRVLLQLTWREHKMHEWDLTTLKHLRTVPQPLPKEGWGAAYDSNRDVVYLSDGSATIRTVRRKEVSGKVVTYEKVAEDITVRDARLANAKIEGLNELEMVDGELWANIYPMRHGKASNCVARVNPITGSVVGWIDLGMLFTRQSHRVKSHRLNYVLNGIAYVPPSDSHEDHEGDGDGDDPGRRREPKVYVTGKQWDYAYDISVVDDAIVLPKDADDDPLAEYVRQRCDLWLPPKQAGGSTNTAHGAPAAHHRHHHTFPGSSSSSSSSSSKGPFFSAAAHPHPHPHTSHHSPASSSKSKAPGSA